MSFHKSDSGDEMVKRKNLEKFVVSVPEDYVVAIPSYNRAELLTTHTVETLLRCNIKPERIEIHVRGKQQYDKYLRTLKPGTYGKLIQYETKPGPMYFRNHMSTYYPIGTRVVLCDDDIRSIVRRVNDQALEEVDDLDALFTEAFVATDALGISLWGAYPVVNAYYMKPDIRTGLSFIPGVLHGYTVRGDDTELVSTNDKDDYERSIRFYIRDGGVLRLEYISVDADYLTEPGGMTSIRNEKTSWEGIRYLLEKYPEYTGVKISKTRGTPELVLKDRRKGS